MSDELTVHNPLEPVSRLVLDSVPSRHTKVMYSVALHEFFDWWRQQGQPVFNRAAVQAFRAQLDARGLAPASINQKLSALRKLAVEAAYAGLLDPQVASAIRDVKGARVEGTRTGNWLSRREAEDLIRVPDGATIKGKRDRAILSLLIGGGLRREEIARLGMHHLQLRDGRWCVVDLRGKHGRVRTIPIPAWVKASIDDWTSSAAITAGAVFRGVNKGDRVMGDSLTSQAVWRCVHRYSSIAPHDLRRTYAKLAHRGGARLDQIQLSLGHASLTTTERYLGIAQDLTDAPCDYIRLDLGA